MDATDKKILSLLQQDGRLSLTELAERVGLSLSPCHRRLRALEASGAIAGYRAQLDPASVGLHFSAIVFVIMKAADRQIMIDFEAAVARVPEVTDVKRLFGEPDYLLNVVTTSLEAFQRLYDEELLRLPGILRLNSTIVMKQVVTNRMLPL